MFSYTQTVPNYFLIILKPGKGKGKAFCKITDARVGKLNFTSDGKEVLGEGEGVVFDYLLQEAHWVWRNKDRRVLRARKGDIR
ncbi:hypothetical protein CEXT_475171 [Caerostris extrusa]|uniref:Uncharacterized protein n=1 Tax=Caerostris extrusa TaxID=172846 RepID=A0AAV4RMF8_CAEEX|nr:hypothetical protein CEXT_475171 [Caerostris extrusa]